jgi:hypothetical protein
MTNAAASLASETFHATAHNAMREYAHNVGMDRPNVAWILTSYDVWTRNPFYVGTPQPCPDADEQGAGEHSGNRIEWEDLPF